MLTELLGGYLIRYDRCVHDFDDGSTLEVKCFPMDEHDMWYVRCNNCWRHTDICLTVTEAKTRAVKEWWRYDRR